MRTLEKNKTPMKFVLLIGEQPIYQLDEEGNKIVDFVDEEGTIYYRETGETELLYSNPIDFQGNIATSASGESKTVEYGVDVSNYDAILVMNKNELPITETSLLWVDSEVKYKDALKTIVDGKSADYKVLAIKPSLNQKKYILGRIVK